MHVHVLLVSGDNLIVQHTFFILAYGVDLTTLLKVHDTKVPLIVKECVQELEKRGNCS